MPPSLFKDQMPDSNRLVFLWLSPSGFPGLSLTATLSGPLAENTSHIAATRIVGSRPIRDASRASCPAEP